ncbi:unnamed protein product, partial [Chrysoparadoxa australica]
SCRSPRVEIEYCIGCRWMLRSAWLAQELLSTFEAEIGEVALQPSALAGTFEVRVEGAYVFKAEKGGAHSCSMQALKQRVRDVISPEKELGHSEAKAE